MAPRPQMTRGSQIAQGPKMDRRPTTKRTHTFTESVLYVKTTSLGCRAGKPSAAPMCHARSRSNKGAEGGGGGCALPVAGGEGGGGWKGAYRPLNWTRLPKRRRDGPGQAGPSRTRPGRVGGVSTLASRPRRRRRRRRHGAPRYVLAAASRMDAS